MAGIPKLIEAGEAIGFRIRPNRREVSRYRTKAAVEVANTSGAKAAMSVEDISSHGCSIKGDVQWLRLGMILSIVLANEQPVQAVIRWVRGGKAGVEFFRPLTAAQSGWQRLITEAGF
jgi:hypothetical protein